MAVADNNGENFLWFTPDKRFPVIKNALQGKCSLKTRTLSQGFGFISVRVHAIIMETGDYIFIATLGSRIITFADATANGFWKPLYRGFRFDLLFANSSEG